MSSENPQSMSHKEAKASVKAQKAYAKATRPWFKKKRFWALGLIALLIIVPALANLGKSSGTAAPATMATAAGQPSAANSAPADAAKTSDAAQTPEASQEPAGSQLTAQQKNAVRSAESYLSFKGFSRTGLIQQLSSDAGEGFDVEDATVAVDSLDVDWNEQAARAAESYLDFKGFSCKGLQEQLSSKAGEGFTAEQAEFGAKQAGACG